MIRLPELTAGNYLQGKNILPVSLLLEGRKGLIVGGGKVAYRKAEALLAAGAQVTVVCRKADPQLLELANKGSIHCFIRSYQEKDVHDQFLVYAATNDQELNQAILKQCRRRRILCNIVDQGWSGSDFISPASFSWNGLTVSVSSGGRSCRRSRLIKEQLSRHLHALQEVNLLVIGTDHRLLSLDKREKFCLSSAEIAELGSKLNCLTGVFEFIILATCNRFELLAVTTRDQVVEAMIIAFFGFNRLGGDEFYLHRDHAAFRHLTYVLAGMHSQVIGETHIVSQVKAALAHASTSKWADPIMKDWIEKSLYLSKIIRKQTGQFLAKGEIEKTCAAYLQHKVHNLKGKNIMVLGTGMLGRKLIALLHREEADVTACYHQCRPASLQSRLAGLKICSIAQINRHLKRQEIIIGAINSDHPVLDAGRIKYLSKHGIVNILDISIPRAADPELPRLADNIQLTNLEDLKTWQWQRTGNWAEAFKRAEGIINEGKNYYEKLMAGIKNWHQIE